MVLVVCVVSDTDALCEELVPSIALILPLYNHLLKTYTEWSKDTQESIIKKAIANKIRLYLKDTPYNSIDSLLIATVTDPRFKGKPIINMRYTIFAVQMWGMALWTNDWSGYLNNIISSKNMEYDN